MPITVQCSNCSAKLNAPDGAAGKRVKCPKCQTVIEVPAAAKYAEAESEPTPPPSKRKPPADEEDRPSRRQRTEKDEDERPSKRSRRDEEEDDRPRRSSRRDEEDEDERPSRRRSSRHDDDEDDERPSRRGDSRNAAGVKKLNVCGLIGLILGIPSIIINFFPCCGGWIPGIIGGAASLALGLIGLVLSRRSEGQMGGGLAIAGTILGGVAVLFSLLWVILFATWLGVRSSLPTQTTAFSTDPAPFNRPDGRPFGGGGNNFPAPNDGAVVKITGQKLAKELEDDEEGTHAKYDGKTMLITGTLLNVADGAEAFPTNAHVDDVGVDMKKEQRAQLATVPIGGLVTIRARYQRNQMPLLADGEVVSTAKYPDGTDAKLELNTLVVQYRANADNPAVADKKYKGKLVEVQWSVRKVNKGGPQGGNIEFNMDDPKVEARFAATAAAAFAALKKDDSVKVRGTCAGMVNGVLVLERCTVVK